MSLERKDERFKLDQDLHAIAGAMADREGVTRADLYESIVAPVLRQRAVDTLELAEHFRRLGITGKIRE